MVFRFVTRAYLSCSILFFVLQGSFWCDGCDPGYFGNQTYGCVPRRVCPDGSINPCDENADCIVARGPRYFCEVFKH